MNLRFMVDSTFRLDVETVQKHNISVIPLNVIIDGVSYRDGIDVTFEEVMTASEAGHRVTTSQPAPGIFLQAFEALKEEGVTDILCLTMSSTLSGTYQSACLARDECEDIHIHVIDTLSTAIGAEMIFRILHRSYLEGATLEELLVKANALREQTTIMMSMRNLSALKRSGRISRIKATIGNLLGVKAIIEYVKGKVLINTKARTENHVIDMILEKMKEALSFVKGKVHIFVAHVADPALLQRIHNKIKMMFPNQIVELRDGITPVIAVNLGYGGFGISWCVE
ncbi:MAG: DegV family protein [Bacilli bacterium]|nr:DegV family protein [Bacilli bacterium]